MGGLCSCGATPWMWGLFEEEWHTMTTDYSAMQAWAKGILEGEQVQLRELLPEDLPILAAWWNETEYGVFQQNNLVRKPTTDITKMFELWSKNDSTSGFGYSITKDGELIGHLTVWGITMPTRIGTAAIIIGPEFQGKGYGRDAMQIALRLAFEEMGANKVEIRVWAYNERAIHLYMSMGFIEEGRRRAATFHRSTFHDEVELGLLLEEYQHLQR